MKTQNHFNRLRSLMVVGMAALSVASVGATESDTLIKGAQELSIRYSNLTGYGVGYQVRFLSDFYARGTAWFKYYEYIKGEPSDPYIKESNKVYNFGLDLQRNIISENKYRVYSMIGGGYAIKEKLSKFKGELTPDLNNVDQRLMTAGAGGGIEYYFSKSVSADLGVTYKFDYLLNRDVYVPEENKSTNESTKETGLGLSVGLNLVF